MRLGKTFRVLLLMALWLSHGFLACRAVQSYPGHSTGLQPGYQQSFYGSAQPDAIMPASHARPVWARASTPLDDQPVFPAIHGQAWIARQPCLSALVTTLAPPELAVTWQFTCRTALFPRSPS